jgi:large subunit ribosomal protein L31
MKKGIHPQYFEEATISCVCGAEIKTGSTVASMQTEICSACHPFYTGKKKFIDTTGRVDRFKRLAEKSKAVGAEHKKTVKDKAARAKAQEAKAADKDKKAKK